MKIKLQYNTQQEREQLLAENSHLILIEEQNITEGNFLVFSDEPIEKEVIYINVPQNEIDSLKQSIAELALLLSQMQMGGM